MSYVVPEVDDINLHEYVRESIVRIETDLKEKLKRPLEFDADVLRRCTVSQAFELYLLVNHFVLTLHPDFSSKLADLMTNRLFY